jgi:hypothetical protein
MQIQVRELCAPYLDIQSLGRLSRVCKEYTTFFSSNDVWIFVVKNIHPEALLKSQKEASQKEYCRKLLKIYINFIEKAEIVNSVFIKIETWLQKIDISFPPLRQARKQFVDIIDYLQEQEQTGHLLKKYRDIQPLLVSSVLKQLLTILSLYQRSQDNIVYIQDCTQAVENCWKAINLILNTRVNINTQEKNPEKSTLLMHAAKLGLLDVVKIFLENGADPSIKNVHGHTALDAAKTGSGSASEKEAIKTLLEVQLVANQIEQMSI